MSDAAGLLDTSVVLQLGAEPGENLPDRMAISSLTLAELAVGPMATDSPEVQARRQALLQTAEAEFEVLSFDGPCAHAWPRIYAATMSAGRKPRGKRAVDLMIATTALANGLPLYTANADDFRHLSEIMSVVTVARIAAENQ